VNRIETVYQVFSKSQKISIDSRHIEEGSIFVALKGENFDAHQFVQSTIDRGAVLAVIDNPDFRIEGKTILVEDSLQFLQQLANYHRRHFQFPIIAITGTNGKTTTKELCLSVLNQEFKVKATQGNLNNHIGVPLSLLSFPLDLDFGIIEMGANHPGEISFLCSIAEPDYGLITNVGKAHLEGFGNLAGVLKTKTELYAFLQNTNAKAFVNQDNTILSKHPLLPTPIFYGRESQALVQGSIESNKPYLSVRVKSKNEEILIHSHLIGAYNLENILAASCIGSYFGLSLPRIRSGIESYKPQNIRSQFIEKEHNKIILDAYNANPTSMKAAIENFASLEENNKLVILGDMLELGTDSQKEHQKIIDLLTKLEINTILTGKEFQRTQHPFRHFKQTTDIIRYLTENPIQNHLILIKASRGIHLEDVLDSIQ
jgi:UDP-N-acetylmuramoyl-tripeptide--D-alanyl-D-alanine ligase